MVRPIFNAGDYDKDTAMHIITIGQYNVFCEYLHNIGKCWNSGDSYLEHCNYDTYGSDTIMLFNRGLYGSLSKNRENYKILEFDDFDWSDGDLLGDIQLTFDQLFELEQHA